MRVLITGATSFLGQKLLETFLNKGYHCYAIVRPESISKIERYANHQRLHIVKSDIAAIDNWKKEVKECDLFYHLAWSGEGAVGRADPVIQEKNVKITLECMLVAAELKCKRFIFAGSQAEYGPTNDIIDEKYPCQPVIEYGKGKLKVYELCTELSKKINIEYVHCRIFSVYGEGDHTWTLVSQCVQSFLANKIIDLSSCEQLWNFLYVDDAVYMMYMLGLCELSDDTRYNIASDDTRPLKEFVHEIWTLCENKGKANFGGRTGEIEKAYGINPSAKKIFNTINWTPKTTFKEGILTLVNSERKKGI